MQFQELQPVATYGSAGDAGNIFEFTIRLKISDRGRVIRFNHPHDASRTMGGVILLSLMGIGTRRAYLLRYMPGIDSIIGR